MLKAVNIRMAFALILLLGTGFPIVFNSCRKDKGTIGSGYPEEIAKILVEKCATAGCHNRKSSDVAAGLCTETWDELFKGDRNGAVCIPYSHEFSTIFLFTNTYSDLGAINEPTMPLNHSALSRDEMNTLISWIDQGAPNTNGKVMWSDNPNRKKVYVTNQGCDVVCVIDAATRLQMRYIKVGTSNGIEAPHMVKVSPDGKYWYVCFSAGGTVLQRYNTSDDSYAGQASIGLGSWNTFAFSPDSKKAFAVDWNASSTAKVVYIDLNSMTVKSLLNGFDWPHGSMVKGNTLYVTAQQNNRLYRFDISTPGAPSQLADLSLDGNPPLVTNLRPHDFAFTPDSSLFFVTCELTNEIRVFDASDNFVTAIPTGTGPVEIGVSGNSLYPYLFITCMSDTTGPETNRGSVTIINYKTFMVLDNIKTNMAEPHGVAVDDDNGIVYISNRNQSGPIPHHTTTCGGKNGFLSFIDIKTRKALPKTLEVAADPYTVALRK